MTAPLSGLATETVKRLGQSAALVSALPTAVMVLTGFGLIASRLYPWSSQAHDGSGTLVDRGLPSVADAVQSLNVSTGILLALAVLVLTVMLRPVQISLVQLIEGYWHSRLTRPIEAVMLERHQRRLSRHRAWAHRPRTWPARTDAAHTFPAVVRHAAADRVNGLMSRRGQRVVANYPSDSSHVMPTLLGNVLRRAETSAGERYGMNTVLAYRRVYPFISTRLHSALAVRFDLLDTMATFVVVFLLQATISLPVLFSGTWWGTLPLLFAALGAVSYAGAVATARQHGELLHTVFDLHRFDLYAGLHHRIPDTPSAERKLNKIWTEFLRGTPGAVPTHVYQHSKDALGMSHSGSGPNGPSDG